MDEDREKTRTDPSRWLEVNPQDTGLKNVIAQAQCTKLVLSSFANHA